MKSKSNSFIYQLIIIVCVLILTNSCKKFDGFNTEPKLSTTLVSDILQNTANSGGTINSDGGSRITARGVCWGKGATPSISDSITTDKDSDGTGTYKSKLRNLTANTTYYLRAYATNANGTGYGSAISFKTKQITIPDLMTIDVSTVSINTAICGGKITSSGGAQITQRGVCRSTYPNPTTNDIITNDGTGEGIFASYLGVLSSNTTYYVRAYAINSAGTGYGNQVTFTTLIAYTAPVLTTNTVTLITQTTATCGGNVTSDGGAAVTERGVCYSTTAAPTTSNSKLSTGTGTGSFVSNITGLTAGTTYYVRAYAINSVSVSYGSEVMFTTSVSYTIPVLSSNAVTVIDITSATCGGNITLDGGATVTARGVCWSTNQTPTITDSKTLDGTGAGSFTSNITGLTGSTTYYVRAYATNIAGTGYGSAMSFTTLLPPTAPVVTTDAITSITKISATCAGSVTSDGGATVTERGICYSNTQSYPPSYTKIPTGTGTGSFVSDLTGLTAGTKYYVRAYAINSIGVTYGNEESFTTAALLSIGDSYQGGIIAYILQPGDPGYIAGQTHGLIAAISDQGQYVWGCSGTLINGADGIALGTGYQNTLDIINSCSETAIAAKICSDYTYGGYSDWYLPSKDELMKLSINRNVLGVFGTNPYLSSSENDATTAMFVMMTSGSSTGNVPKNVPMFYVRAVRSF